MSIWFNPISLEDLTARGKNTLSEFFEIEFTDFSKDSLTAIMPVTDKVKQPLGIVHGGANVVLAETLASTAANISVDLTKFYCVGLEINANHIRSVTKGVLKAITKPIHLGRTTQIWHIDIFDDKGKQTCVSRMTAAVLTR